jgi:two-component system, NtrC family, sensor kinase
MKKIFLAVLLLTAFNCFSQTRTLDSLKKLIDNDKKEDSVRVSRLVKYSYQLFKAASSSDQKDYSKSVTYLRASIELANKINRLDLVSFSYLRLGRIYSIENKNDTAISILLEGLGITEKLNLKNDLPWFYSQLGEAYRLSNQLDLAEYYDRKYYNTVSSEKNDTLILDALDIFISLNEQKRNMDTVKILLNKALTIAKKLKFSYYLNRFFMQKGELYYSQGKYYEAVQTYHEAASYKILNYPATNTFLLKLFSDAFLAMNNKDSAGWYARAAVDSAKKYNLKKELGDAYQSLYKYYYHFGEYKNAFDQKLLFDSIQDQLTNPETGKTIMQAQMNYAQQNKDLLASIEQSNKEAAVRREKNLAYSIIIAFVLLISFLTYSNRQKQKAKIGIEKAYGELKSTQAQLVQSEKMASLGELTAGIAHEIQNPLNFVNNFSDVNKELIDEMEQEMDNGNISDAKIIAKNIRENEKKISMHGKRADAIVKAMLQHSSSGTGVKEASNINALVGEYLRLAYHGLRAKEKLFNAIMETDFDQRLGLIQIVPQDIGRVLLNLYNNAFYAVMEKMKMRSEGYEPTIVVSTKKINQKVIITVRDNGGGIPQKVQDKIFQPFFTTKPTGQGTGLGLSLSYDIVKAHGGEIRLNTREGEFAEFTIQLPV